jgi:hypothetical protein
MKIKILELDKHRNETTFRPYIYSSNAFREYGVEFVEDNSKADIYFVGQASIIDKKLPLNQSVENGVKFLSELDKPYILFDGQDSSTLMGVWDVFKQLPGIKLAKNVIHKNKESYLNPHPNGRWFWGEDVNGYKLDKSDLSLLNDKLVSSGTNWLNTYGFGFKWNQIKPNKKYDVAVLIGLSKENYEHGIRTDGYYNQSRLKLFEEVNKLKCKVVTTEKTGKLNKEEYFKVLEDSKFCISPFGYGEVNIREIECLLTGTVIIKPSIPNVKTGPYIYNKDSSCFNCNSDFSDINQIIEGALDDYNSISELMISNQRKTFDEMGSPEYIVQHVVKNIIN